jgi:hypothetical protein
MDFNGLPFVVSAQVMALTVDVETLVVGFLSNHPLDISPSLVQNKYTIFCVSILGWTYKAFANEMIHLDGPCFAYLRWIIAQREM